MHPLWRRFLPWAPRSSRAAASEPRSFCVLTGDPAGLSVQKPGCAPDTNHRVGDTVVFVAGAQSRPQLQRLYSRRYDGEVTGCGKRSERPRINTRGASVFRTLWTSAPTEGLLRGGKVRYSGPVMGEEEYVPLAGSD